jgi:hypothetical protein
MISCKNADQSLKETGDNTTADSILIVPMIKEQCYENKNGADTVQLKLTDSSGIITGNLDYRIEGKDANTGTFKGNMYGDTLIADYKFKSEGKTSMRQIAFLRKDSFLIEGFGPVMQVSKQMKFKSRDSLTFNEVNRLLSVPCK